MHHKHERSELGGGALLPPEGGRERRLLARPPDSVTEVLAWILTAQPENALDALEQVSLDAKASSFTPAGAVAPPMPSAELEESGEWQSKTSALLAVQT